MEHNWNHLHSGAANADWEQPPSHAANGQPNPFHELTQAPDRL